MIRKQGMFGCTDYQYRGIRIEACTGRYLPKWEMYLGDKNLSNRVRGWTLKEMQTAIDNHFAKVGA